MENRRTRVGAAWSFRAAVLVVGLVASIGLPATAGAATPSSSSHDGASRTTPSSRVATSSDAPATTTPVDARTRASSTPPTSEADESSSTPATATPPSSEADEPTPTPTTATPPPTAVDEAGWVLSVSPAALTVQEGRTATFTAEFTWSAPHATPFDVQWQTAPARTGPWTDLRGSNSAVLESTATLTMDGDLFRAVVSTDQESSSSPSVILHVQPLVDTPPAEPLTATPVDSPTATPVDGEPYGTVARPELGRGQEQTAIGHNFTPGTMVRVTVEPAGIDLGTYPADADGIVTTRFPTGSLPPGSHTVEWAPV